MFQKLNSGELEGGTATSPALSARVAIAAALLAFWGTQQNAGQFGKSQLSNATCAQQTQCVGGHLQLSEDCGVTWTNTQGGGHVAGSDVVISAGQDVIFTWTGETGGGVCTVYQK